MIKSHLEVSFIVVGFASKIFEFEREASQRTSNQDESLKKEP